MYNEIMESINKIDSTIMEAEVNVASAMIDAYTKAAMIMEYCDDIESINNFNIIQESFDDYAKDENFNIFSEVLKIYWSMIKGLIDAIIKALTTLGKKITTTVRKLKNIRLKVVYTNFEYTEKIPNMIQSIYMVKEKYGPEAFIDNVKSASELIISKMPVIHFYSYEDTDHKILLDPKELDRETLLLLSNDESDRGKSLVILLNDIKKTLKEMLDDKVSESDTKLKKSCEDLKKGLNNIQNITTSINLAYGSYLSLYKSSSKSKTKAESLKSK